MLDLVCFSVDASSGGFCVQSTRVFPPGTEVTGTIEIDGKSVPFAGTIAWAQRGHIRLGVMGRMGVRLSTPLAQDRAPTGAPVGTAGRGGP